MALIATGFGAVLTVGIAFATYRHELRSRERNSIRHLANFLASRRALVPATPVRVDSTTPQNALDLAACQQSVRYARDAIVEANRATRPGSEAQESADRMARAANQFLEMSRHDPDSYWIQLNELRDKFVKALSELGTLTKQSLPEPGSRG